MGNPEVKLVSLEREGYRISVKLQEENLRYSRGGWEFKTNVTRNVRSWKWFWQTVGRPEKALSKREEFESLRLEAGRLLLGLRVQAQPRLN